MISVCMTSHNGGRYIKEQIDSILSQINEDDELIISDDGSTDGSLDIIKSYDDRRIQLFSYRHKADYSKKHLCAYYYASANFNNALIHASGDYIFFADQDDIWMPDKVEVCIRALQKADIVCHNFGIVDSRGRLLEAKHLSDNEYSNLGMIGYWKYFPFRGCCLAFNRKAFDLSVPIPAGTFEHDCWIGMNGIMHGLRYKYISYPLMNYRRHTENVSELKSPNSLLFKLQYRMKLLFQILRHW